MRSRDNKGRFIKEETSESTTFKESNYSWDRVGFKQVNETTYVRVYRLTEGEKDICIACIIIFIGGMLGRLFG